jgi:hypothetical protein
MCTILEEMYRGMLMMKVEVRHTKQEIGWQEPKFDEHDWGNQRWRYEPFIMECAAAPLWNLLERSVDFERLNKRIVEEVVNA